MWWQLVRVENMALYVAYTQNDQNYPSTAMRIGARTPPLIRLLLLTPLTSEEPEPV
ncbi:hypothetical protein HanHA300_Chr17g0638001 [Helianthus annuus]|nr:hypothetical protein HanHA300_Chr17g0638001 [Helianthus annuus]KAJ0445997.1 hypothetical protein HanHA89_Chr17g0689481 [Helianthus annuus]KAJ0630954.1 hypothetical protein HanLR1_Chr17g0648771 [Helianthus annuus]KAJ0634810.1 hypothetical protein HanOQP8_Chr17g0644041 [Helianthus annuus]